MSLVRDRMNIPISKVFACVVNRVLMEDLDGLIGMDLYDGYEKHKCEIPCQYKDVFF